MNFWQRILSFFVTVERPSPPDIVPREDIIYDKGKETVTIHKLKGIRLGSLADTNSMDGFMDIGHTPILTTDFLHTDLAIGDIIVYEVFPKRIIHQIVKIGSDKKGWYCRCQGLNNPTQDKYIIRPQHIKHRMVGIIY